MTQVMVWSGWVGGIGIGLFLLLQYAATGKALGCSTGYGNACGVVSRHPYFNSGEYGSRGSWRLWFLIGLPLGGLLAALTSSGTEWTASLSMGELYDSVLPSATWARGAYLIAGGMLIGLGARMAGGCPSGHAINGMSLRNPPSLLASGFFFVGGIIGVQTLFHVLS